MPNKFRGRRLDNGEWAYGYYVFDAAQNIHQICTNHKGSCNASYDYLHEVYLVDPATVGQFTGLHDKKGKEIYEGGIVVQDCYLWFADGQPNYRGTVEWIYSQWQVVAHCVNPNKRGISDGMNQGLNDDGIEDGEKTDWEVIGNIHDNPNLLEVAE